MDLITIENTLLLAFGLGLLHALDADHIMAVSGLAAKRPSFRDCIRFCFHWATGHGLALAVIAASVYLLGLAVPEQLSAVAESLVGVILIMLGLWTIKDIKQKGLTLSFHKHEPDIHHAHWQKGDHNKVQDHSALLVGLLHGTAGSAPLLLLIPLSKMGSASHAMAYVLLFGLGVIISMLIFGGLMAHGYKHLAKLSTKLVIAVRGTVALSAIGLGSHLLYGYL